MGSGLLLPDGRVHEERWATSLKRRHDVFARHARHPCASRERGASKMRREHGVLACDQRVVVCDRLDLKDVDGRRRDGAGP